MTGCRCTVPVVELPISKSKLDKLGTRLAEEPVTAEDLVLLSEVMRAYQSTLDNVVRELRSLNLEPTSRVKTTGVLLEKLRRERGMSLSRVQDLAGARIVIDGGRDDQDDVKTEIVRHFDALTGRASRVRDRRLEPTHGYRAVHVVVFPDGIPVEIQVRTELQNHWAQLVEGLGDRWGRDIRYGGGPEFPTKIVEGLAGPGLRSVTRREVVREVRSMSENVDFVEEASRRTAFMNRSAVMTAFRNQIDTSIEKVERSGGAFRELRRAYRYARRLVKDVLSHRRVERRKAGRFVRRVVPANADLTPDLVAEKLRVCHSLVDETRSWDEDRLRERDRQVRASVKWMSTYVGQGGLR